MSAVKLVKIISERLAAATGRVMDVGRLLGYLLILVLWAPVVVAVVVLSFMLLFVPWLIEVRRSGRTL
jgi:hypothetical protein